MRGFFAWHASHKRGHRASKKTPGFCASDAKRLAGGAHKKGGAAALYCRDGFVCWLQCMGGGVQICEALAK